MWRGQRGQRVPALNHGSSQPPSACMTPRDTAKPNVSASRETGKHRLSGRIDLLEVNKRAFCKASALLQSGILGHSLPWVTLGVRVQAQLNV